MKRTFYTGAAIIYALNKKNEKDVDVFFWHVKQQNTIVNLSEIDFTRNYLQKAVCHFRSEVSVELFIKIDSIAFECFAVH